MNKISFNTEFFTGQFCFFVFVSFCFVNFIYFLCLFFFLSFYQSFLHALRFNAFRHTQNLFQRSLSSSGRLFFLHVLRNTYRATFISPVTRCIFFVICSIILLRCCELHKKLPSINFLSMYRAVSLVQKSMRELELQPSLSAMLLDLLKQKTTIPERCSSE